MQLTGKECREDTGTGRVMDQARDPWVMALIPCGGTESLESLLQSRPTFGMARSYRGIA